jgi:hypothetical protein
MILPPPNFLRLLVCIGALPLLACTTFGDGLTKSGDAVTRREIKEVKREVKYCGRDYGDRIHWMPVPQWFEPNDCARINLDALWSDLYVACYIRSGGMIMGGGNMGLPKPNHCGWSRFDPSKLQR